MALQILTAANDSAGAAVALLRMGTLFRKLGEVSAPPAPEAGPGHAFPAALGLPVLLMFPRRVRGFSGRCLPHWSPCGRRHQLRLRGGFLVNCGQICCRIPSQLWSNMLQVRHAQAAYVRSLRLQKRALPGGKLHLASATRHQARPRAPAPLHRKRCNGSKPLPELRRGAKTPLRRRARRQRCIPKAYLTIVD